MLKVLEIDFHLEYIRTTNTADFKNSKNPSTPVIQSADNINAPPNLLPLGSHGVNTIWKRIVLLARQTSENNPRRAFCTSQDFRNEV
jgi:hypothetical protein